MEHKLKSQSGETLVETLFAMLIVVLSITMLAGAIVTAARINKSARDLHASFVTADESGVSNIEEVSDVKVTIVRTDGSDSVIDVNGFRTKDANKYCFYTAE